MIPYGKQEITQADLDAVADTLSSPWLTQGPAVPRFEQALARYCTVSHAVAFSSATAALHAACFALDVGPGDWVWTSPNTFVASANCALYCGAKVDFVDIDPATYNMSVDRLAEKLAAAEKAGTLPKVVIPVHFSGQSCDMRGIHRLAQQYHFSIVEDASHAIGGRYEGQPVGDCRYSDLTVFSFHPVKIITTGEGGALTTRRADLAEKLTAFRSHGITRDPQKMVGPSEGAWYYQQTALGFNYRLTDIQAALGFSQLHRLDAYVERRTLLAKRYDELLKSLPVTVPFQATEQASAWHLYVVLLDSRKAVFERMRELGIGVNVHYIPVHTQPYYQNLGFRRGDFPVAENYYERALSLPMFATLTESEQEQVVDALLTATQVV